MSKRLTLDLLDQTNELTAGVIAEVLNQEPEATGWLCGLLGNAVGSVDDIIWLGLLHNSNKPCDTPGCNCVRQKKALFAVLDAIREDRKKVLTEGGGR